MLLLLSWWREILAVGILGSVVFGARVVFADFLLDRFGDVLNDHLRRVDRQADSG